MHPRIFCILAQDWKLFKIVLAFLVLRQNCIAPKRRLRPNVTALKSSRPNVLRPNVVYPHFVQTEN